MAHRLQINARRSAPGQEWNPERQLAEALAERALFLEKYPQYRTYQREIERMLDQAGTSENRMAVLALLIEAKLIEMHDQLKRLNRILLSVPV
ncbi:MAG: hypothetical protein WAU91_17500 [Desulfatitalea sp.]